MFPAGAGATSGRYAAALRDLDMKNADAMSTAAPIAAAPARIGILYFSKNPFALLTPLPEPEPDPEPEPEPEPEFDPEL